MALGNIIMQIVNYIFVISPAFASVGRHITFLESRTWFDWLITIVTGVAAVVMMKKEKPAVSSIAIGMVIMVAVGMVATFIMN